MNPLTTLAASRWLIVFTTSACLLAGIAYAVFTRPVYRSDMLIQVEPSTIENRSTSGDPKLTPEIKPDTTSEIQVLSSRMVVSRAVEALRLHVDVTPRYLPVVGGGWPSAPKAIRVRLAATSTARNGSMSPPSTCRPPIRASHSRSRWASKAPSPWNCPLPSAPRWCRCRAAWASCCVPIRRADR
uniref:Wzz/FepE/Etk N-terminal domain-containing protein n=1 Tax=Cupriavidus sp. EM10 TaxID=2839983 RepID=UPI001CED23CC|nr:Wzz/FepE/Etk N-terminal domain-containing protein [Cupriavidus sp. EM10]